MPELMEVLEFIDNSGEVIVARVPAGGECEIKYGAQLTVRESQSAIFYRDGTAILCLEAGRHILTTQNIPILTKLVTSFGYGETSPFRSEVYFVSRKLHFGLKWGTPTAFVFHDPILNMIQLRAFGTFSIKVVDPQLFVNRAVGTQGLFFTSDIVDYLRSLLINKIPVVLTTLSLSFVEINRHYEEIALNILNLAQESFEKIGISIEEIVINAISPTKAVQKVIDDFGSMNLLGDLSKYTQFQAAKSIEVAANNQSMGDGLGLGLGLLLPDMIRNQNRTAQDVNVLAGSSVASPTLETRLKKLKELLDTKLISNDDYENRKNAILNEI
jgi:membrane protease subunit (stomatin/prohibitin family)